MNANRCLFQQKSVLAVALCALYNFGVPQFRRHCLIILFFYISSRITAALSFTLFRADETLMMEKFMKTAIGAAQEKTGSKQVIQIVKDTGLNLLSFSDFLFFVERYLLEQ